MIGEIIGKWKIIKKLNQGGMADIYLAEDVTAAQGDSARVAVKILRLNEDEVPGISSRFQREIEVLRSLKHDNIVRLYESGDYAGRPYLVMEFVDGLSLDQVLQQRGKLHWEEVVTIGQMVAGALRYAHRQEVIHRDIKPANLLASWDRVVKLTDFGIARLLHETKLTKEGKLIGTASYLSPEQAAGKSATRKSDLYSLGIVLYELVTGRLPFEAATDAEMLHKQRYAQFEVPSRLIEEIPAEFDQLIVSLLDKNPDKRPPNALAVEDVLNRLRRKMDRKRQYTPTPAARPTKVMERESDSEIEVGSEFHKKLRKEQPAFPVLHATVLIVALMGLYGLYTWLRQPASLATLSTQIEKSVSEGEWDEAQKKYGDLERHYASEVGGERLNEIRLKIEAAKTYQQARFQAGPFTFSPPKSEAERFYRKGVLAYFDGRVEEARKTWLTLTQAFRDSVPDSAWVRLAEEALKQSEDAQTRNTSETIKKISDGQSDQVLERLVHLKALYEALPDSALRRTALQEIEIQFKTLKERKP